MAEHPIQNLMGLTLDKVKQLVDSNTIIGNPIKTDDGITILPVSKVTFGFASGGSEFGAKTTKDLFGGGSGAGVTIAPVAFLVIQNGTVRTIQLLEGHASSVERAISMMPDMVDKISAMTKKGKEDKQTPEQTASADSSAQPE